MNNIKIIISLVAATLLFSHVTTAQNQEEKTTMATAVHFKKMTSVLLADDVAACVAFWADFGIPAVAEIPGEGGLSFAILASDGIEIMYQSSASAKAKTPAAIEGVNRSMIYMEVAALDAVLPIAKKYETVVAEHVTDYGAREIYIRDPAGNLIGFAEQRDDS